MLKLISCGFNMDTASVELRYQDSSMVSIYCPAVEDLVAESRVQRTELDWLIYNEPLTYAQLVLSGEVIEYLNRPAIHGIKDEIQAPRTWKSTPSQKMGCSLSMPEYSPYSFNPCPDKCRPLQTLRRCR